MCRGAAATWRSVPQTAVSKCSNMRLRNCGYSTAKSDRHRTSFNARNREKERAARLPEPLGLNNAARQDALAVANDLFGFQLRDVAGAHLEPAGHHLVGIWPELRR